MSVKKLLLTASALALLTGNVFADGGPVAEEPPAPPPEPVAPPPEEEAAPPPPPAAPAPSAAWYGELHGGAVWADDLALTTPGGSFIDVAEITGTGWAAGGALGYDWGSYRAEFEVTHRHSAGTFFFDGILPIVDPVEVDSLSLMFNVAYDFDMGSFLVPYVGAGMGASDVSVEVESGPAQGEDSEWAFAYQFIGGFSVPMPNSSVELFADYRYMATAGLTIDFDGDYADNDDYRTHNVMGGIRFNF